MKAYNSQQLPPIRWRNVFVMLVLPIALALASITVVAYNWSGITLLDVAGTGAWFAFWLFCCVVSVCIKHRIYSHKNGHFAKAWAEKLYVIFSVIDVQGSILRWSIDHRHHHHGEDPHDINRGWWWACYGWMMRHYPELSGEKMPDLQNNRLLTWQDKHYGTLLLFACYIPLFAVAGLAEAFTAISFWQVVLPFVGAQVLTQQNTIFFVNVLSHVPELGISYDDSKATDLRRLAGLWGGIFTGGEGRRHGRHHLMPYQPFLGKFDWNGWALRGMAKLKLIKLDIRYKLKDVPQEVARKVGAAKRAAEKKLGARMPEAA